MIQPVTDITSFKAFLRTRAKETWDERQIPYYLSFVATDLKKQGVDYRDFTGPLRLVQWAASEQVPDTKLVSHPTKKAKVGFVPADIEFAFDDDGHEALCVPRTHPGSRRGHALVKFVETLTVLPDEVAETFTVPAKVLVSLLKR